MTSPKSGRSGLNARVPNLSLLSHQSGHENDELPDVRGVTHCMNIANGRNPFSSFVSFQLLQDHVCGARDPASPKGFLPRVKDPLARQGGSLSSHPRILSSGRRLKVCGQLAIKTRSVRRSLVRRSEHLPLTGSEDPTLQRGAGRCVSVGPSPETCRQSPRNICVFKWSPVPPLCSCPVPVSWMPALVALQVVQMLDKGGHDEIWKHKLRFLNKSRDTPVPTAPPSKCSLVAL
jgi:hypothetical protein